MAVEAQQERHITKSFRIGELLLWRIERYRKRHGGMDFSAALRYLAERGLGEMDAEERRDYGRWLKSLREEASEAAKAASPSEGRPPMPCPGCGQTEIPIIGGDIYLVDELARSFSCNNCGHRGTF